MKEFIEKLIGRLEEEKEWAKTHGTDESFRKGRISGLNTTKRIVNQLAEEYGKDTNVTTNALHELNKFLKGKFDYCAEQAEMNLEAECNSEIASYFRNRKELYLDRANIYGEVMREVDRLSAEHTAPYEPNKCDSIDCPYYSDSECQAWNGCGGYQPKGE